MKVGFNDWNQLAGISKPREVDARVKRSANRFSDEPGLLESGPKHRTTRARARRITITRLRSTAVSSTGEENVSEVEDHRPDQRDCGVPRASDGGVE